MKKTTDIIVANPQAYFPEGTLIPQQENQKKMKTTDSEIEYSF